MGQSITHRNHYIPQFYLKNWSLDGRTIQTYSILVSNANVPYWTQQPIKSSATWNDFYTRMEGGKEIDDFEHWFDREFEAPAKPILDKLIGDQKISHEESIILSHFVFSQYVRTPAAYQRLTRQSLHIFPTVMDKTIQKLNTDTEAIQKGKFASQFAAPIRNNLFPMKVAIDKEHSAIEVKALVGRGSYLDNLRHLLTHTLKVAERYDWQVLHAAENISFPTTDDPVICINYRNENDYDFKGGWGRKNCNILMDACDLCLHQQLHAELLLWRFISRSERFSPPPGRGPVRSCRQGRRRSGLRSHYPQWS